MVETLASSASSSDGRHFFDSTLTTIRTLEDAKENIENIVDQIPLAIFITNAEGEILRGNLHGAKILMSNTEKVLDANLFDYIDEEVTVGIRTGFEEARAGKTHILETTAHFKGHKKQKTIEWKIALFKKHDESSAEFFIIVAHDRTEVVQAYLEAELAKAKINIDPLTRLFNRRYFDEVLTGELARCSRSGLPFSIVMLDIDKFKPYNDNYGHVKGDECIKEVAKCLAKSCHRPGDCVFRYGGEEFAIILPETHGEGALKVAEMTRKAIEDRNLEHEFNGTDQKIVTASFGVYEHSTWTVPGEAIITPPEVVEKADKALYRAKKAGRNQCVLHHESQEHKGVDGTPKKNPRK